MRYLITTSVQEPFLTNWFDAKNHFNPAVNMVVYDIRNRIYTDDGENWKPIKEDSL